MAGKFINTNQKKFVNSMVDNFVDNIMSNPIYTYNQSKPTIVTYYNIDKVKSSLDKALLVEYATMGKDSPIYYNKIIDFFIYGFQRIDINIDTGEFGEEASEITGESLVLPNTITPCPGDYFIVPYIKEKLLFKVIDVQLDTLEDGNNMYKISYKLSSTSNNKIETNVLDEYEFLIDNVGTHKNPVIKKTSYNKLEVLDTVLSKLRRYYKDIFFNSRVQTFTFKFRDNNFYDSYMIEFLKRTDIINNGSSGSEDYVYIDHSTVLPKDFNIIYDSSIYKALELRNKKLLSSANNYLLGEYIDDSTTIFQKRYEDYYSLNYKKLEYEIPENFIYKINNISDNLISNIETNTITNNIYENITVKYFNNNSNIDDDLKELSILSPIKDDIYYFYIIPIVLYCIESRAYNLLS